MIIVPNGILYLYILIRSQSNLGIPTVIKVQVYYISMFNTMVFPVPQEEGKRRSSGRRLRGDPAAPPGRWGPPHRLIVPHLQWVYWWFGKLYPWKWWFKYGTSTSTLSMEMVVEWDVDVVFPGGSRWWCDDDMLMWFTFDDMFLMWCFFCSNAGLMVMNHGMWKRWFSGY